jgi:membrane protease YdiL (CAAX protease family)
MSLKEFLKTKKGTGIELFLFFTVALSTLPLMLQASILVPIAIISLELRKTEWKEIGFSIKDFTIKKIFLGMAVAVLYSFADQYLISPVISKFTSSGLPEIFSMKGNVTKLLIGLLVSWTTAAFFEELLFRGYLINRLIDLTGESLLTKIIIALLSGIAFAFVHAYQGLQGAVFAGFFGVFQAIIYFIDDKKVTIPIIAHGTFDSIGFISMFIG